ncbi:hypothetical protein D3C76_1414030 [compost metagenome]
MLGDVGVVQHGIGIQQAFLVLGQQELRRLATCPCCATYGSTLLIGILKKSIIAIDDVLTLKPYRLTLIHRLGRFLYPHVANRCRSAFGQQVKI